MLDFDLRFLITWSFLSDAEMTQRMCSSVFRGRHAGREVTSQAVHLILMKHRSQCLKQKVVLTYWVMNINKIVALTLVLRLPYMTMTSITFHL